jgi:hypothetical protein
VNIIFQMPELPEDVIHLIYKHYYQMYVLPEIKKSNQGTLRKSWKPIQCPLVDKHHTREYPNPCRAVIHFLQMMRNSQQFWDVDKTMLTHTIGIVNIELLNAPLGIVDYFISAFPIVERNGLEQYRIVLQGDRDDAWNDWIIYWLESGWVNIKEGSNFGYY